jgi:DNA-binding SARP family transcriptional activator
MLAVSLFGVFRISCFDARTWSELGPAGRGLTSYLFTYLDRPHRRERLADLFWPDLDAERARRALNSAIWRIRKLLAAQPENMGANHLLTVGREVTLEHVYWLDIDAWSLHHAAALMLEQPAALHEKGTLRKITAALYRYKGPFLDGDDGDWILEERERFHSLFLRTTTMVVRYLGQAELYDDAIRMARNALRFDPYREELERILLILLALDERRGEAIRCYEDWSKSLKRDLDIYPLPTTLKVVDEIRGLQSSEGLLALRARLESSRW